MKLRNTYLQAYSLCIFLLVGFFPHVIAQNLTKSPYSVIAVGDMQFQGTAKQIAMGNSGIAAADSFELNPLNPASYSSLKFTTFEAAYLFSNGNVTNGLSSSTVNTFSFTYFMFGFPISIKRGIALSAGLQPYSSMGYDLTVINPTVGSGSSTQMLGTGGLTKVYAGTGFKIFRGLTAGFQVGYLFGQTRQSYTLSLSGRQYFNINNVTQTSVGDLQYQAGLQYLIKLKPNYSLRIGVAATLPTSLSATRDYVYRTVRSDGLNSIDTVDKLLNQEGAIQMPAQFDAGLCITHRQPDGKNQWVVQSDYSRAQWADFRYFGISDSLINSNTFQLGFSFIPNTTEGRRIFSRTEYRLGIRYHSGNINLSGSNISTIAYAVGLGLPLGKSKSRINLTMEYLERGTTENRLIQESYFRFILAITMSERWFVRYRYD